jgi:hypothetical protein
MNFHFVISFTRVFGSDFAIASNHGEWQASDEKSK